MSSKTCLDVSAVMPDQLSHYVMAVSGIPPVILNGFPFYLDSGHGVLAALNDVSDGDSQLEETVNLALAVSGLTKITVLAARAPEIAPENAEKTIDYYWMLDLPALPCQKRRNMLNHAAREVTIATDTGKSAITAEHTNLVKQFCNAKGDSLDEATRFIYGKIDAYAASSTNVKIFSAWKENTLAGFAVADFTPLDTPFYMFAFRSPTAPPGVADYLLHSIIRTCGELGYASLNLGLGINTGIEFFKKSWGARPWQPLVETSWMLPKKRGLFARIASRLRRHSQDTG